MANGSVSRTYRWDASLDGFLERIAPCPWTASAGLSAVGDGQQRGSLYSPEQRRRRDASPWTMVQAVLAPLQFAVFLISLALVLDYLVTGQHYQAAAASVLVKTAVLYTIMITGAIWEKDVFGQYLFAPAFFWEDVFSMLVIALHTLYVVTALCDLGTASARMMIALAAYASYCVNATQFVLKLRAARLQAPVLASSAIR